MRLDGGRSVPALAFVADPGHPQYAGDLPAERAAALVRQGRGSYGTALDYLRNAVAHLDAIGIADGPLHRVLSLAAQEGTTGISTEENGGTR